MDLDSFYCSVEILLDPELAEVPFVVGGRAEERGVVASASYASRKFGIRSAMPTAQALRLCPELVVISNRRGVYSKYSKRVMDVLDEFTPTIEQISIDEAFLDVTGVVGQYHNAEAMGRDLQQRIMDKTELSASLGMATNKLVAKIASDRRKPHGIMAVLPGHEAEFLARLPVRKLWGIGPKTAERLHRMGIDSIEQLAASDEANLARLFGKHGRSMARHAHGIDNRLVVTEREAKSISQEVTFSEDVSDERKLVRVLLRQSEDVARSLRRSERHASTVKLKLRWSNFTTLTRQTTLALPTNLTEDIYVTVLDLLHKNWPRGRLIRLIGVGVSNFGPPMVQLGLFDGVEVDERRARLAGTLDELRARFGSEAITRAALLRQRQPDSRED